MKRPGAAALAALVAAGVAGAAPPPERWQEPKQKGLPALSRVEEEGGVVSIGRIRWKKEHLEVDPGAGSPTKKIPYRRIASIEEVDHESPPEHELERSRAEYHDRKQRIEGREQKDPKRDAQDLIRLGAWAQKKCLPKEAEEALRKALELEPDDVEAHRLLGEAKDRDGAWKPAGPVFVARRNALGASPKSSQVFELVKFATRHELDEEAIDLIFPLSQKDAYDKAVLAALRPVTDRRRPITPLRFPLVGKWRVSADRTHHHEKKTFAVYAVDMYREVDGMPWKGRGTALEDHYAWDQPIYAAADGVVVEHREGFPDNPVDDCEGKAEKHNGVYVMHGATNESTWYLHTKKGTTTVKKGDRVKKGQLLGKVGNSGGSAQPHLHFTLVDARHAISVPWRCEDYWVHTDDGSKVKVKRGRPLEGQLIEIDPFEPPATGDGTDEKPAK